MAKIAIYHNPRCSKSRSALGLLEKNGADFEIIERPIVVNGKQAVIGRPPERVLDLL